MRSHVKGRTRENTNMIEIKGRKAAVLAALYNNSKAQGASFLHFAPKPMTEGEAETLLEQRTYFDYLQGRVMKTDFSGDTLDPRLYDRDNGEGAAARAVAALDIDCGDGSDLVNIENLV
jgi:hypothetical protein